MLSKSQLKLFLTIHLIILIPNLSDCQWVKKWEVIYNNSVSEQNSTDIVGTIFGDFNGDGSKDILLFDYSDLIVHNGLTGNIDFKLHIPDVLHSYLRTNPVITDIDNDGSDEIVLSLMSKRTVAYEFIHGVGINEKTQTDKLPESGSIAQNYPNPFNPNTKIDYSINKPGPVDIMVFNELGQRVKLLLQQRTVDPGNYSIVWDGKDDNLATLSSGTYYYQIRTNDFISTKKAIFLK